MKIVTIVGARPQFVKAAIVSKALAKQSDITEIVVHTGQHFDGNMSDIFFEQLDIAPPAYKLDINGGTHGEMTGQMLIEIEAILLKESPDYVLVYGDTNSTLAGALAASKIHIPVVHVEAGLRSFNMQMPEEINRILTDKVSSILFCPTDEAINNLDNEGFSRNKRDVKIIKTGDVMFDIALKMKDHAQKPDNMDDIESDFVLVTCHRQENTDDEERLTGIIDALNIVHKTVAPVVCPLHPRTAKKVQEFGIHIDFKTLEPVGYLEMLWLLQKCGLVATDSGGLQKEAYFMGKPCVTLRDQTEWVELVDAGANILVGAKRDAIITASQKMFGQSLSTCDSLYGDGHSADIIAKSLSH